ncbi:hypothetical protein B0H67DRAFT_475966 [Lasiosphaeris hirsuta]|uniref:DUF726-domain-containing protein n=1 Tax=Lasiosphaeris hirsuta TaxID=260670 RepID=A0AA40EDI2_9PEZI|nr:hypothetical protein B0H67DRAFT_475966 [Lasiosphaeris hirsuta]
MPPLATDPSQLLIVLNLARRKALYTLITEIAQRMRSHIELGSPPYGDNDSSGDGSHPAPGPELVRLRAEALAHFDTWRGGLIGKLREALSAPDDAKIVEQRRKRTELIARRRIEVPAAGENLIDFRDPGGNVEGAEAERAQAVATLQASFHPIPTRLVTIAAEDREEALSCVLLLLLSAGKYSAESRVLAVHLASALEIPLSVLNTEEAEIATSLLETSAEAARQQKNQPMSAEAEAQKRKQDNQTSRYWKVGLASVAGAAIVGITGGLAAPVVAGAIGGIMGSVGLGGVASFLGIFWMNGALVGTLFGALGGTMTGEMVDQYAREVEDFRFIPLEEDRGSKRGGQKGRRLRVTIGVNGWLNCPDDITKPWRLLGDDSEVFALRYEMKSLLALGKSLEELISSYAWSYVKMEILKRTVLATLWSALWPTYLLSVASSIDNPFNLAKNRSEKAGEILADALINRVQGERPVTLVGYSLGARTIYSCLRSLAKQRAFGLVETVVFIGAPVPSNRSNWMAMRSVVSGKIFNVYSENDYLLAFLYRATSIQLGIAGLQEIENIDGVENLDLSEEVQGHLRYPNLIEKILARCEFPIAKGAATEPIGKDEDAITLEDADRNQVGTLIELDHLTIEGPPKPARQAPIQQRSIPAGPPPPEFPQSPQREKQRTAVTRAVTSSLPTSDPLGAGIEPSSGVALRRDPLARSITIPAPATAFPSPTDPLGYEPSKFKTISMEQPNLKYLGTARDMALRPKIDGIPQPRNSPAYGEHQRGSVDPLVPQVFGPSHERNIRNKPIVDKHKDEDEDEGFGIKMVDNDSDGDFAYVEPIPIEDQYLYSP